VGSQDSQLDELEVDAGAELEAELDAALDKEAEALGMDPEAPYANEQEMIRQWQRDPTMDGFDQLHAAHQPLINSASSRYMRSTTLPKAAVKAFAVQRYTHALQTYNPDKGTQFKTYLYKEMQRVGRYLQSYQNVGRIPEQRAALIPLFESADASLRDTLGREPTNIEMADEMLLSAADVADMRKERITPKVVGTLRKELRQDLTAELPGGSQEMAGDSNMRRQIVFLHGSLNPEQQLVLEHTYEGFGRAIELDDAKLGKVIGMSPQKIRSIKSQIKKKVDRFW
jgi:DNA-directed RNA polymerase specialized sigma subunit